MGLWCPRGGRDPTTKTSRSGEGDRPFCITECIPGKIRGFSVANPYPEMPFTSPASPRGRGRQGLAPGGGGGWGGFLGWVGGWVFGPPRGGPLPGGACGPNRGGRGGRGAPTFASWRSRGSSRVLVGFLRCSLPRCYHDHGRHQGRLAASASRWPAATLDADRARDGRRPGHTGGTPPATPGTRSVPGIRGLRPRTGPAPVPALAGRQAAQRYPR